MLSPIKVPVVLLLLISIYFLTSFNPSYAQDTGNYYLILLKPSKENTLNLSKAHTRLQTDLLQTPSLSATYSYPALSSYVLKVQNVKSAGVY